MRSQEIKSALLSGGLVLAPRRSGKTKALTEILRDDPTAYVIVCNGDMADFMRAELPHSAKERVIVADAAERHLRGRGKVQKIFVDEAFWNPYKGSYFAAVSSLPDEPAKVASLY